MSLASFARQRAPHCFAVAVLVVLLGSCVSHGDGQLRVVDVVDGDTVEMNNGLTLRYIGIDAPETKRRTASGWIPAADPYGAQAAKANEELVLGRRVRLEYDLERKDKYGRTLAYVFVTQPGGEEIFVQVELLRRGLAYFYTLPPNVRYVDVLLQAQREARVGKRGLWSQELQIASQNAASFVSQRKFVNGLVKQVRRTDKTVTLEMEGLMVVIFTKDLGYFYKENIDPATVYANKRLNVFGLIKMYHGIPEIIVSHPGQIEVLG